MDARQILARLRRGDALEAGELAWFARGLASGEVSDAQAGAFAMAVCLQGGLGEAGRVALTHAMRASGTVLRWDLPGPVLDKHSTGGVGDCVSLLLAPALAAAGAHVPMISGRGLGHTGGTLDKLEALPGYRVSVEVETLRAVVGQVGCAIVGAGAGLAPADRRLYAVRDVTATVDQIDLITASILSKKLAAGLEGLVLDVKAGSGAFMREEGEALALARTLVDTANGAGCPTAAFVTDMDQPLAPAMGNAVEVALCLKVLAGDRLAAPRLFDLTVALGGRLLALAGNVEGEAEERLRATLLSGAALERFEAMVAALGGPRGLRAMEAALPVAPVIRPVPALRAGVVVAMDGQALGAVVIALGGGRRVESDPVDPSVGLTGIAALGAEVAAGAPLALVHARSEAAAEAAVAAVQAAITLGDEAPEFGPLVRARLDPGGRR